MERRTLGSWLRPNRLSIPVMLFFSAGSAVAQPEITHITAVDVIFSTIGQGQPAVAPRGWALMWGEGVADESSSSQVFVNGVETRSFGDSTSKVFFMIPSETLVGPATFTVAVDGVMSAPFDFRVSEFAPTGAFEGDTYHLDRTPVSLENPAQPGETVLGTGITGLGAEHPPQLSVTVAGHPVEILSLEDNVAFEFSLPGVYTLEAIVPAELAPGAYQGTLTVGGVSWTFSDPEDLLFVGSGDGQGAGGGQGGELTLISDSPLPAGMVGQLYAEALLAVGGAPPYACGPWSWGRSHQG